MPDFSPKILIRADQLAQRYSVTPSFWLAPEDSSDHVKWCIDEAAAIAGNLQEQRDTKDKESTLEGPSGKIRLDNEPDYPYIGTVGGQPVIRGNIPIIPPPAPKS
jgi:hypothetical protein